MIGQTTIRQCAALLERSSLYFGNDTGLAHIAAAFKLPMVEIFCHPLDGSPPVASLFTEPVWTMEHGRVGIQPKELHRSLSGILRSECCALYYGGAS